MRTALAEAHAMVNLVEQGWADQNDVARAFGYSDKARNQAPAWSGTGVGSSGGPRPA